MGITDAGITRDDARLIELLRDQDPDRLPVLVQMHMAEAMIRAQRGPEALRFLIGRFDAAADRGIPVRVYQERIAGWRDRLGSSAAVRAQLVPSAERLGGIHAEALALLAEAEGDQQEAGRWIDAAAARTGGDPGLERRIPVVVLLSRIRRGGIGCEEAYASLSDLEPLLQDLSSRSEMFDRLEISDACMARGWPRPDFPPYAFQGDRAAYVRGLDRVLAGSAAQAVPALAQAARAMGIIPESCRVRAYTLARILAPAAEAQAKSPNWSGTLAHPGVAPGLAAAARMADGEFTLAAAAARCPLPRDQAILHAYAAMRAAVAGDRVESDRCAAVSRQAMGGLLDQRFIDAVARLPSTADAVPSGPPAGF
ncbi:MAG: hypothetical protein RLZZ127_765 [Planctomycetota bacterium]